MNVVEKDVRLLVKKELAAANERFPLFSSAHEGWAVIREKLAEVEQERYMLDQYVETRLWNEVRFNTEIDEASLNEAQKSAVNIAVEAIQTAAIICKLKHSQRRWKKKMRGQG